MDLIMMVAVVMDKFRASPVVFLDLIKQTVRRKEEGGVPSWKALTMVNLPIDLA